MTAPFAPTLGPIETPIYDDMLDELIPGDSIRWWQLWSVWRDLGLPDRQSGPPEIRVVRVNPKADQIADVITYHDQDDVYGFCGDMRHPYGCQEGL